jgi:hypothetical protein
MLACGGTAVIDAEGIPDCEGLERDYQAALARAKACGPTIDEDPCVEQVAGGLSPCDACITWANIENRDALDELQDLSDEYIRAGCANRPIDCPAISCENAPGAVCGPSRSCEDMR